jgi:hypothetical protein
MTDKNLNIFVELKALSHRRSLWICAKSERHLHGCDA